jgi:uncharacterized membrane protein
VGDFAATISDPVRRVSAGIERKAGLRLSATAWIVLSLTILAAVIRFATLDVQSVWLDESATMILVRRGFGGMLSHLSASESAPPLYYVLVWAWTKVFGIGVVAFRSFSALAGTLTVPAMYAAGRRISTRVGMWAAALTIFSPAMYYYSQEARCYALLILFAAAAFAFWQYALAEPTRRNLTLWAGASILALLTHYFAVFLFIPELIIITRRVGWRRVLGPTIAVSMVGLALVPLAVSQHGNGSKSEWIEETALISRVAEAAKQYLVGLYGPLEILTALISAMLAVGVIALAFRSKGRHLPSTRDVFIVVAVAIGLPLLGSASHLLDVFNGRNVIATWVPFAVLLATGLGAKQMPTAGAALGISLCIVSCAVIAATNLIPGYQRDDWRDAVKAIPHLQFANRIIVSATYSSIPLSIYLPGTSPLTALTSNSWVATREIAFIALRTRRTGRAPLPPVAPIQPPAGFSVAEIDRTEAYAVSRFVASRQTLVQIKKLRGESGEAGAEITLQH